MSIQNNQIQNTLNNISNIIDLLGKPIVGHTFKKIEEMNRIKPNSTTKSAKINNNGIKNSINKNNINNNKIISDNLNKKHNTSFDIKSKNIRLIIKIKKKI